MIELTPEEQIAKHYSACMDSVALIDLIIAQKPESMTLIEANDTVKRNVDHLKIMIAKGYWEGDALKVLQDAADKGEFEPINEGE